MGKMVQVALNLLQPMAFGVFLVAGILCLITKQWHQAWINLGIANANFAIFYGARFFNG